MPPHATPRPARPHWRWLERLLFVAGFASLAYFAYVNVEAALYQAFESRELDAILSGAPAIAPPTGVPATATRTEPARGAAIGRIEIPRLGVSAVVRAGVDARTLNLAVGHIPGTAFPGEPGNVGLAGHRDTFFRRLRHIRADDEIRLVTAAGTQVYHVERTLVVEPHDVWVLDATGQPALTLVTCYPFTYIGSAPHRFIVRAMLSRGDPTPPAVVNQGL